MDKHKTEGDDPEEDYANAYWQFMKTLVLLSTLAEKQCEIMNNYNVAWELRDDASSNAKMALIQATGHLSAERQQRIRQFIEEIESLPDSVIHVSNTKDHHLKAMNSPEWSAIRLHAQTLLERLKPETDRVRLILWPENSTSESSSQATLFGTLSKLHASDGMAPNKPLASIVRTHAHVERSSTHPLRPSEAPDCGNAE